MPDLSEESSDWLLEYVLGFFGSPAWEVPVLSFIDENCVVFDSEDENKFIYTDIHEQFRDLVDGLLSQHLAEVGISGEDFAEACSRASASGNKELSEDVLEHLLCMDDFLAFKKLMVRRNIELDMETAQSLKESASVLDDKETQQEFLEAVRQRAGEFTSEDLQALADEETAAATADDLAKEDAELRAAIESSMTEMDLLHLQEQVYQRELEQAIALSIQLEEERVRLAKLEAKQSGSSDPSQDDGEIPGRAPKQAVSKSGSYTSPAKRASKDDDDDGGAKAIEEKGIPQKSKLQAAPLPRRLGSLGSSGGGNVSTLMASAEEKRKIAEETYRKHQEEVEKQKALQEKMKAEAMLSQADIEARAKHMKAQRDAIVQKKKKERESKLQQYKEEKDTNVEVPEEVSQLSAQKSEDSATADSKDPDVNDAKRMALRVALARKMKQELLETKVGVQLVMPENLERQIGRVERLREENRQQQEQIMANVKKQADQRNRNMMIALKNGLA